MELPLSPNQAPSATHKCAKYFRRILKFDQMDFQFAMWQMLYLFIAPQKLTKLFRARKHSKSQYARDDPAFLVLFAASLCITSIGFAAVLRLTVGQFFKFLLFVVFVDCIGIGVLVASLFWLIANTVLKPYSSLTDVEWAFSFDIHLNAFYPPLILLHFIQLIFYNGLINHEWFISVFFGNTFWLLATFYYFYITFVGYSSLQVLNRTRLLLSPLPWIVILYIFSLIVHINISHVLLNFYKYRVV